MSKMFLYSLVRDWDAIAYRALLKAAERRGGYCLLVQRQDASEACHNCTKHLAPSLDSSFETMRWPGTIVLDDAERATLLKYRVNPQLISALRSCSKTPFDWMGPDLPEDLCFLRADGRPWFVSVAHERDAFFKLLEGEVDPLRSDLAGLELIAHGEDQVPDERY